jgi:hypothetical protein
MRGLNELRSYARRRCRGADRGCRRDPGSTDCLTGARLRRQALLSRHPTTEDPFVADELSLPTVTRQRFGASGDEPGSRETDFAVDMSKRITDRLGIGFGATYKQVEPAGGERQRGFDNFEASIKYQFFTDADREAIVSAGLDWDIGGSGTKRVGAESFSTLTPAIFFGKGFGDLPEDWRYARPFALTGSIGVGFPTRSSTTIVNDEGEESVERHPHTLEWNFALEYSIPYLQSFVKDMGIGRRSTACFPWSSSRCRRRSIAVAAARPARSTRACCGRGNTRRCRSRRSFR